MTNLNEIIIRDNYLKLDFSPILDEMSDFLYNYI